MADEKKYTEREKTQLQRAAFHHGAKWRFNKALDKGQMVTSVPDEEYAAAAAKHYPLPKMTRPRVVKAPLGYYDWRIVDGALEERRTTTTGWSKARNWEGNAECIAAIVALAANPTEEVEVDA